MKLSGLHVLKRNLGLPMLLIGTLVGAWSATSRATSAEGAALYKSNGCPVCHGQDGSHPVIQDYPVIAGQNANFLLRQMRDIRDGRRTNGLSQIMREVVAPVTDEEFSSISAWLALQ
ncbi:MAG: c-type cytochrome [Chromatiaceae bacterium]